MTNNMVGRGAVVMVMARSAVIEGKAEVIEQSEVMFLLNRPWRWRATHKA